LPSDFVVQLGLSHVQLLRGDITTIAVDAIVNAANAELAGGGGVDGAIHRAAGPEVMRELQAIRTKIGRCDTGSAVVTGAGRLPARYIFHAVGPVYRDGEHGEPQLLASCYETCLGLAAERDVKSISFPSISTGVYGYPIEAAAEIALSTVASWLRKQPGPVNTVKLVQFSDRDHDLYVACARKMAESEGSQ
jgi:O-acetyl-ADP-ribose deacetylase (regulator of RNase III)